MAIIPVERIERATLSIRGEKVMLDSELAELYGVETRRLNQQVRRNLARFPADFMFQLAEVEKREVIDLRPTCKNSNFRRVCPSPSPNTVR